MNIRYFDIEDFRECWYKIGQPYVEEIYDLSYYQRKYSYLGWSGPEATFRYRIFQECDFSQLGMCVFDTCEFKECIFPNDISKWFFQNCKFTQHGLEW